MSFFKNFFKSPKSSEEEQDSSEKSTYSPDVNLPLDELFVHNFRANGGKFLYCDSLSELKEQFINILEENDWFECEATCFEPVLFSLLKENKLNFQEAKNPKFHLCSCECLTADEGSVVLSEKQIKHLKPNEISSNIIIFGTTSQLVRTKTDGLREIKKKYVTNYPSNITSIKNFSNNIASQENFLSYGSCSKNLYLLLLEDL
jgi:hypothetical protein